MTRRAEHRNEIKTRVEDDLYDAVQIFKQLNYIDSDSAAAARLMRMALFGVVGNVRPALAGVSAISAQPGTRECA
ncbi:hypothetical protein BC1002_6527 [Paraburkholderia atlantica]|uniref:Uncharacterized protein n=1 Tax=Paraburkholderia atlantica TaxID=2654982 RepID=D5WMC2_PARAM|nr:hypothetical protein [Paraburkholderia atlantica]ADG20368.1 hypothetical protein BC1002_6527 [Paraburkholderia atlantica]